MTLTVQRSSSLAPESRPTLRDPAWSRRPEGLLDPNPIAGETILGRNAGRGPAQILVNLRVSRTWGFGGENKAGASAPPHGIFAPPPANRRYNISLGMSARNILNQR